MLVSRSTVTIGQFALVFVAALFVLFGAALTIAYFHDKNAAPTLEEQYAPGVVHRDVIGGYNSVIYCNPKCTVWREAVTVSIAPSTEEMLRKLHEEMHAEEIPPSEILR